MKFLVLATPVAESAEQVSVRGDDLAEWLAAQRADDVVEVAYAFPDGGGCLVANADSADDLRQQLSTAPLPVGLGVEIRPLAEPLGKSHPTAHSARRSSAKPGGH